MSDPSADEHFDSDFESLGEEEAGVAVAGGVGEEEEVSSGGPTTATVSPDPHSQRPRSSSRRSPGTPPSSAGSKGSRGGSQGGEKGRAARPAARYDPVMIVDPAAALGLPPPDVPLSCDSALVEEAARKAWLERFPLLPPKSGIDLPQVWPPMQHVEWVPPDAEPLVRQRADINDDMVAHDSRRFTHPHLMRNRTVYDSVLPSPFGPAAAGGGGGGVEEAAANAVLMSTVGAAGTGSSSSSSSSGGGAVATAAATAGRTQAGLPRGPGRIEPWFDLRSVGPLPEPKATKGKKGRSSNSTSAYKAAKLAAAKSAATAAHSPLVFESRFEGGNLRRAVQIWDHEYDLILKADVNTNGHNQWFYFSVRNMVPGVPYKFNIINLTKSASLFGSGMRPLMYSATEARTNRTGWFRFGRDVAYYGNHLRRQTGGAHAGVDALMTPPVGSEEWIAQAARLDPRCVLGNVNDDVSVI